MHRVPIWLCLVVVILFLVMAGMSVRLMPDVEADELASTAAGAANRFEGSGGETVFLSDPLLGWVLAPNLRLRTDGVLLRTDSRGLRSDREYSVETAPGIRRIAAFGDGYTQCSGVSQDECWVPILEGLLPRTEILNFGVDGYGLEQSQLRYLRDGRQFRPCVVLIGYAHEDVRPEAVVDPAHVELSLTSFAAQVSADGAAAVVVIFPSQRDVRVNGSGTNPHAALVSRLGEVRLDTIDLTEYLTREAPARGLDELYERQGYSAFANRRVARYLAGVLPTIVPESCDR